MTDNLINLEFPIHITKSCFDASQYISRRVCELMGTPVEVGFYYFDDNTQANDNTILRYVTVGFDQTVNYTHCESSPDGMIDLSFSVQDKNMRFVGWGHSHSDFGVFYSNTDYTNILSLTRSNGIPIVDKDGNIQSKYLYGMTYNANGADPYCVIQRILNGKPDIITTKSRGYFVIPDKQMVDYDDIDDQLIERVHGLESFLDKRNDAKKVASNCTRYLRDIDDSHGDISKAHYFRQLFDCTQAIGKKAKEIRRTMESKLMHYEHN